MSSTITTTDVHDVTHFHQRLDALHEELEALGDQIEVDDALPDRLWEILRGEGLMRMTLPAEWGGHGMSVADYVTVLERVAGYHGAIRMYVHGMNGLWRPLHAFGTEDQKARWLPLHAAGERVSFALTEAETGTGRDVGTTAELQGDEWVITGRKNLISFAEESAVMYVVAATGTTPDGQREISCILVPPGTPGMTVVPLPEGMGCKGTAHDEVRFDGCRVPAENLLGARGQGLEVSIRTFLDVSRLGIATSCLGLAQRTFDLACDFAADRVTFGRPIASRQAIQMSVGESAAELYGLRMACHDTARRFDAGESIITEAAMCKLLGIDVVGRVTDRSLKVFGGIGWTKAHRVERLYRDARAMWFEEGTQEIQKLTISRRYLPAPA